MKRYYLIRIPIPGLRSCFTLLPVQLLFAVILIGLSPAITFAGMPYVLSENVYTELRLRGEPIERLQVISFFLGGVLLSALAVKWLWNGLQLEFTKLPKISYGRSLLVTIAWGLLFCIVLVMISGARELMTPGAWKKNGATYQLNEEQPTSEEADES